MAEADSEVSTVDEPRRFIGEEACTGNWIEVAQEEGNTLSQ